MAAGKMRMWEVGEDIEIGIVDRKTHQTNWVPAIVLKLCPLKVKYMEDGTEEELPLHAFRRRPEKKLEDLEPKKLSELPPEVLKDLYHKALVEIIKEGDTRTPNATVKRMINIAKEALGEVPI